MNMIRTSCLSLFLLLLSALPVLASAPKVESVNVKDYEEPIVIVHFWASGCAPCLVEFPALLDFIRDMDGKVRLVAVSLDYKDKPMNDFIAKQPVDLPITWLHDNQFKIAYRQYEISQTPENYIYGPAPKRDIVNIIKGEFDWARADIRKRLTAIAGHTKFE